MSVMLARGKADKIVKQILAVFEEYKSQHPTAEISLYRHNVVSIRIKIIDPEFAGLARSARHSQVWSYLHKLPDDTQSDVSMLVLLTPDEVKTSLGNLEFDNPCPSPIP